jgi:hypothetical protein
MDIQRMLLSAALQRAMYDDMPHAADMHRRLKSADMRMFLRGLTSVQWLLLLHYLENLRQSAAYRHVSLLIVHVQEC